MTLPRSDLFVQLPDDVLNQIISMLADEDVYFFARTGMSIFLVVARDIFWKPRVSNCLQPEITNYVSRALSTHYYFSIYALEELYSDLTVHQAHCFQAARHNDLPKLQSLKQHVTLALCNEEDGGGNTFAKIVRRYGDSMLCKFVFDTVCESNIEIGLRSKTRSFLNRDALTILAIHLDQGEGYYEELLLQDAYTKSYRDKDTIEIAIKQHSFHSVRVLLSYCYTQPGPAVCQLAAQYGTAKIMQLLIDHGVDVDAPRGGITPLETAAKHGNLEVIQCLLDNGALINFGTVSPLYKAMEAGHVGVVKFLLENGAHVQRVPLLEYQYNHLDCYKFVRKSVIYAGAYNNRLDAMIALFEYCAAHQIKLNVDDLDEKGGTPLFAAAERGHADMCALLLKHGAVIERKYNARTPLYVAAEKCHLAVVKVLCQHQAALERIGPNGDSALFVAAQYGHADVVAFLCQEMHCKTDVVSLKRMTPLLLACHYKHEPVAKILLQYPSDVNFVGDHGKAALHYAANQCWEEIIELLIQRQADVNLPNSGGFLPLFYVTYEHSDEKLCRMLELLIQAGADLFAKNQDRNILEHINPYNTKSVKYMQEVMEIAKKTKEEPAPALKNKM